MWDERHKEEGFAYGTEPNDFLKSEFLRIPKGGRVLCLAEGEGRIQPIITNCTFSNNSASGDGGAISCSNPLQGTAVANSILWGDNPDEISCDSEISVTYSDIQGEATWYGTGNINAAPMFVDQANGDFHLLKDSPCIDAGDNSALALPSTDIDGDDRKIDDPAVADTGNGTPPIVDMGADEYFLSSTRMPLSSSTLMPMMLLLLDD